MKKPMSTETAQLTQWMDIQIRQHCINADKHTNMWQTTQTEQLQSIAEKAEKLGQKQLQYMYNAEQNKAFTPEMIQQAIIQYTKRFQTQPAFWTDYHEQLTEQRRYQRWQEALKATMDAAVAVSKTIQSQMRLYYERNPYNEANKTQTQTQNEAMIFYKWVADPTSARITTSPGERFDRQDFHTVPKDPKKVPPAIYDHTRIRGDIRSQARPALDQRYLSLIHI